MKPPSDMIPVPKNYETMLQLASVMETRALLAEAKVRQQDALIERQHATLIENARFLDGELPGPWVVMDKEETRYRCVSDLGWPQWTTRHEEAAWFFRYRDAVNFALSQNDAWVVFSLATRIT